MDLSAKTIETHRTDQGLYRRYLGGSGLGVKLLSELGNPPSTLSIGRTP